MKKVLLLVDQRARDLASVLLVGEYLRDFGVKVAYCNKGNMLAAAEMMKPDVFVTSCSEGQHATLARYLGPRCRIALMTQEGACATKESTILRHTFGGIEIDTYVKGLARVYLWSEISRQWLLEEGVYDEDVLRVVGTSRLDLYRLVERRNDAQGRRVRVGFAGRGAAVNPVVRPNPVWEIDEARAGDGPHRAYVDQGREWEDWIWHCVASVRVTLEAVEQLASTGQYEIVFRPDPYENRASYDCLKKKYACFQVNADPILANFIEDIDVLVTEFSTTGTEALLLKKPVISVQRLIGPRLRDHNSKGNHLNPEHMRLYWQPEDWDEFLRLVRQSADGRIAYSPAPEQAEGYLQTFYNWPSPEPSAAGRIAHDLFSLCHEPQAPARTALCKQEYREHPSIERLARRTRLPVGLVRRLFLRPWLWDMKNLVRAYRERNLTAHFRTEVYPWQRKPFRRVRALQQRLKKLDSQVSPAPALSPTTASQAGGR
jgi:surface carbohydrate biosynthesis protein